MVGYFGTSAGAIDKAVPGNKCECYLGVTS